MAKNSDDHDLDDDVEIQLTIGEAAVRKWASVKRISLPSVEHLIDLGFDSMEALALLTESDLTESEIPLGQRKLIVYSVKQTFPRGMAATSQADSPLTGQQLPRGMGPATSKDPRADASSSEDTYRPNDEDGFIRDVLGQMNRAQGRHTQQRPVQHVQIGQNGTYSWQDPQIYLKSLTTQSNTSYFDIVDFVSATSEQSERVLSNNDDGQLIFKSGPVKPKLESLSISQWSVANLAIMQRLY